MCYKKSTCPMYLSHNGKNKEVACKNCVYIQKVERNAFYAKTGLVIAVIGFLVSTYLLF